MSEITIIKESNPKRCEVCHRTDQFVPENNFCYRCNSSGGILNINNLPEINCNKLRIKTLKFQDKCSIIVHEFSLFKGIQFLFLFTICFIMALMFVLCTFHNLLLLFLLTCVAGWLYYLAIQGILYS